MKNDQVQIFELIKEQERATDKANYCLNSVYDSEDYNLERKLLYAAASATTTLVDLKPHIAEYLEVAEIGFSSRNNMEEARYKRYGNPEVREKLYNEIKGEIIAKINKAKLEEWPNQKKGKIISKVTEDRDKLGKHTPKRAKMYGLYKEIKE